MEVVISKSFIERLVEIEELPMRQINPNVRDTFERIQRLIISDFKIKSDLSFNKEEALKIYSDFKEGNNLSIKELFIKNLIKNNNYYLSDNIFENFKNNKAFYFGNSLFPQQNEFGLIYMNDKDSFESFYQKCTVNSNTLEKDYKVIAEAAPPCNSMLFIDTYIFGNPAELKLKNLIKYIKIYKNNNLTLPFHLSIITSCVNNGNIIDGKLIFSAMEQLNKIDNLEYCIYLLPKPPAADRLFFTNYTYGTIGHPFDDKKTVFSQNFMGRSDNLKRDYCDFLTQLKFWNGEINKIQNITKCPVLDPIKMKENPNTGKYFKREFITTKFGNLDFRNRLFDNL